MKTATAEVSLDIWVHCPYCTEFQEVTEQLKEELGDVITLNVKNYL